MSYFRKRMGFMAFVSAASVLCQGIIAWILFGNTRGAVLYVCIYAVAYIVTGIVVTNLKAVTTTDEIQLILLNLLPLLCAGIEAAITGAAFKTIVVEVTLGELSYIVLVMIGRLWKSHCMVTGWTVSVSDSSAGLSSNKKCIEKNHSVFMLCGELNLTEEGARAKLQKMLELYHPPYVVVSVENDQLLRLVYGICDEMGVMVVENKDVGKSK